MQQFEDRLTILQGMIGEHLEEILDECKSGCDTLDAAVRHSVLDGGKRLRPALALLTADGFGAPVESAIAPACALELVHAASLVIDDLPSMDDADIRRGRPSTHAAFGEPSAILAAIALINEAFSIVARSELISASQRLAIVEYISTATGARGLSGGQSLDLSSSTSGLCAREIESMHMAKTGALFVAALEIGATCANIRDARLGALREFGRRFGLAFQIFDDLIDVYGNIEAAGKNVGQDVERQTFVSLLGPQDAMQRAEAHVHAMLRSIAPLGPTGRNLRDLLEWLLAKHLPKISPSCSPRDFKSCTELGS